MPACQFLETCPFFNDRMPIDQGVGMYYKQNYCQKNFLLCARYTAHIALGPDKVPTDLYPNMNERAEEMIESSL